MNVTVTHSLFQVSLRNLSMTLRQVGAASQEERIGNSKNVICVFTFQLFVLHTQKYLNSPFWFFQATLNMDLQGARRRSVWTQVMEPHGLSLEMHTCPISFRWSHSCI